MSGIVGCVRKGWPLDQTASLRMRDSLLHRGPDDAGLWNSPADGVMLGSRRLAILDRSPRGHQPMRDDTDSFTIAFNGEIYNWLELRDELKTYPFRSHTDTEVLLAAYARWGTQCLTFLNGMFAFAIWDARQKQLFAARDRFGEKPFYFFRRRGTFLFASEMKALFASGLVPAEPNLATIYRYLAYRETDASGETFFRDIAALPPAHALLYSPESDSFKSWQYWDIDPGASIRYPDEASYSEHFLHLLSDSVKLRLRSDVTVGSCLSGGLDSSTIVSLVASQQTGNPQVTFSARSDDPALDEEPYVRSVSQRFSTTNVEVCPDPLRLVDEVDSFVRHQEHPSLCGSVYAQWCVMRLARDSDVTVLLDGQGGDEHLAGYQHTRGAYFTDLLSNSRWQEFKKSAALYLRESGPRSFAAVLAPYLPQAVRRVIQSAYGSLSVHDDFARSAFSPPTVVPARFASSVHNELYRQLRSSMLPKLLRFADRNSMAFSREVRSPFLDHRIAEYLFAVPESLKINGTTAKVILRQAAQGRIPDPVLHRSDKKGFEVPEGTWLLGPLRRWAEGVLHSPELRQRGWIDPAMAQQVWKQFLNRPAKYHSLIFRWLSLETWARVFLKPGNSWLEPTLQNRGHFDFRAAGNPVLISES
ncbi:MAG TPA: asparagine synthase (glutamine-hydrolyzing) [Candidatus Acidoferrum sp.]|jgi:asparagine synthase (glutamine-hydrolysing)